MKKIFLFIALIYLPTLAFSIDLSTSNNEVKLEGLFHFQSGFRSQTKLINEEKNVSGHRKNFAFYTEAALAATVARKIEEITYGGKIVLQPTTYVKTSPTYNGSHLFVESEYGKFEAGSPYDASSKMRVTAYDIVAATGDNFGRYANFDSQYMSYKNVSPKFVGYEYFLDSTFKTDEKIINDGTEPPRLISYYIPKYNGFQVGISYIPDSSNSGTASPSKVSAGKYTIDLTNGDYIKVDQNVKDAFAVGISYEHNISDGIDLKVAATGEYGKPAGNVEYKKDGVIAKGKINDLKAYNLGAIITCGNFSYAASYGSLGKSLTTPVYHKTGHNTAYYNGALAYTQGPINASLSYFKSGHLKNTLDAISLGTDYKLAPGLLPYAELTLYKFEGRPTFYPMAPKKRSRGTTALLGFKLGI